MHGLMHRGMVLAAALVAAACGGDDTVEDDGAGGAGASTSTGGMGGSMGGGGSAATCASLWADQMFEPDPTEPLTQLHGTSTFDGERLWIAWSRPDGASQFDSMLAAFACDGSAVVPPLEMTTTGDNELDPALAVSGDRLLAAWTSDNGLGPANLDIRYRIYALDGTPVTDVIELAASRNGVPVTGNALNPDLAPTADGWMLTGIWGHEDAPAFQAFAVAIDRDGVVQGEAQDAELDVAATQTHAAVAVDGADVHLVWQEEVINSMVPSAWTVTLGGPVGALGDPGGRPDVAPGPWLAWDSDGADIVVRAPGGADVALGLSGLVHDASIASVDGQAAVAWMEIVSGIANRILVARLGPAGELGTPVTLGTEGALSAYPIDLTLADPDHALVVYQDGMSPNFRLRAELVTLP